MPENVNQAKKSRRMSRFKPKTHTIRMSDGVALPTTVIGHGKPVLMLHAFGMDARQFLPFVLPLCASYRFYLPHLRGWGLAAKLEVPKLDFIEQYADDTQDIIAHICRTHTLNKLAVAAISMGALVMWAYLSRYGASKISRYLNIDQSPMVHHQPDCQGGVFGKQQQEVFAKFAAVLATTHTYRHIDDFTHLPYAVKRKILQIEHEFSMLTVARWQSQNLYKLLNYQPSYRLPFYPHSTWRHKMHCLAAYLAYPYDYRDSLGAIDIPVTLLIGERSTLYAPVYQNKLTALLPNATAVIVPKSGHAIPLDRPVLFYQVFRKFVMG